MPDITGFAHPEQANGAGDVYANNLTKFGNEVIADFKDRNQIGKLIKHKSIVDSKSYQFPVIGRSANAYHSVGAEILGTQILTNKININVDDRPLISDVWMDDAEKILSHYDERAPFVEELSRSLSDTLDQRYLQVIALASEASAAVTGGPTGSKLTVANTDTDMSVLLTQLFVARKNMAVNNVPMDDLFVALDPVQFYLLAQENDVIDSDLQLGENGGINVGEFMKIAGFTVVKTNHLPDSLIAADSNDGNTYNADFSDLVALVWHPSAAMTVEAKALTIESDGYEVRRQGQLIVGKTLQGTGVYRPECAVSIYHT